MTALLTILFCISSVSLTLCFLYIRNLDKDYAFPLKSTLVSAFVIAICHIAIANTQNYNVASFFHSVFFIFIDVLLLSIFDFSRKYTKYRVKLPWFNWVLIGGGVLDGASSFLNLFFQHSFTLAKQTVPGLWIFPETTVFKTVMKWPYYIHLCACYFVVFLLLLSIIIRLCTTPKIYRFMFTNLLIAISITVIGDATYVFSKMPIDFSIIFSAISSILICIYAIHFTPTKLIQKQLQAVVSNMNDSVVVFDIDGELIYKNISMENFEKKYSSIGLNPQGPFDSLRKDAAYKKMSSIPDRDFDEDVTKNGITYSFHISIRSLRDDNDTFLGAFFIIHDKTEEMEKLNQERYLAVHDKLTDLYNREGFYEKVRSCIANSPDHEYLIICADIDNFKIINDLFGRDAGDDFLIRVGNALKQYKRDSDICARLSGDRFAMFMKKEDYVEQVFIEYPERVSYLTEDLHYPINFHIGVYEIEDISMPVSVMCDRAFMAINTIKGDIQQKIAYYNSDLRKSIVREQHLVGSFYSALASEQFQMYLQPQVNTKGEVHGAEALVRWKNPKEGLMPPDEFVPIFERKGLITTLDKFIWETAAQKLQNWKERGITDKYISVNISPKDFVYIDVYKTFIEIVKKYEISPSNLKLEITETAILLNLDAQLELIKKLREAGFLIEIDDFGSGYSSLNLLKDIPFDILKIDMGFLQATENQDRAMQILHSIIKLSKRLNMPVITEGVETKEQVEFLKEMGTDYYQGFYFARPMPVSEFEATYIK